MTISSIPTPNNLPYYLIFVLGMCVASLFWELQKAHEMRNAEVRQARADCAADVQRCHDQLEKINNEFHAWLKHQDIVNRQHIMELEKLRKR